MTILFVALEIRAYRGVLLCAILFYFCYTTLDSRSLGFVGWTWLAAEDKKRIVVSNATSTAVDVNGGDNDDDDDDRPSRHVTKS